MNYVTSKGITLRRDYRLYAPRTRTRTTIQITTAIIPQMIPAFAIPSPCNSCGFSLILLIATAPIMIANGPRTTPKTNNPTIPQTIDATARPLVLGCEDVVTAVAVADPIAIEAVGLDMMKEDGGVNLLWNG